MQALRDRNLQARIRPTRSAARGNSAVSAGGTGNSGTLLPKKLGIRPASVLFLDGVPDHYWQLLQPVPDGLHLAKDFSEAVDIAHLFQNSRRFLEAALIRARQRMRQDAVIWVSWPKKVSGVTTDITDELIRGIALPLGLVDIKICSVDDVWSGLKLVLRRELRQPPVS